jgi:Na+-translocating ferredoxin:NAD+ oxidoreductase RnfG subunit
MSKIMLKLRVAASVVAGLAILAAGAGCAGSASTSPRTMPIETVREVFPSATEVAEVSMNGGTGTSAGSDKTVVSEIRDASKLFGYLVETQVRGRSGPFRIAVLLDDRLVVKRATVVSYPWSHGRGVGKRSFTRQFEGKGPGDAIEIGKDIDAVTGATISCRAMAQGVRQSLGLLAE